MPEDGVVGVAVCPRGGCPSEHHDVTFIKDVDGYVIRTDFTCRVCGAIDSGKRQDPPNATD